MADSEPGPSGRGGGASGRGTARKFAPTIPGRRKKVEDSNATGSTAADAAAANEAFLDLIKAAQSEAKWERGRGRGRGRGTARAQVAFGGGIDERPMGMARRAPSSGTHGGSHKGASHGGSGSAKVKSEPGEPGYEPFADADEEFKLKKEKPRKPMLDYSLYYPSVLPMRPPELDGEESEAQLRAEQMPVPVDLAVVQDAPDNPAGTLGLHQPGNPEHMFLLQLPATLPLARPQQEAQAQGTRARGPSASKAAATSKGAAVKELPSGKLGKLLVFESGKIKLQIGEVLLDVYSGTPLQTRQDVAALNVREGHCVLLGDLATRMVLCPDVMQLVDDAPVPEYERGELRPVNGAVKGRLAGKDAGPSKAGDSDEEMLDEDDEDGDDVVAARAGRKVGGRKGQVADDSEGEEEEEQVGRLRRKVNKQVKLQDEDEEMEDEDDYS